MNSRIASIVLFGVSRVVAATEETFTTAGPLDCTAITQCSQTTADGLFVLRFDPTYPVSGPSASGFVVHARSVEIASARGGLMDLNLLGLSLLGSTAFNGADFIGAIALETQDATGAWTFRTQWWDSVGSAAGIYVMFTGMAPRGPVVRGVRAIRLTAVYGTTAFQIHTMNATAY